MHIEWGVRCCGVFDVLEYGLNFTVFRSKVTSRKLMTFLLALMVTVRT